MNILLILLGASLLVYSLCELRVWGGLFFDRDNYCIEKFRTTEKAADLVSCWHNITKGIFGFLILLMGLKSWLPTSTTGVLEQVFLFSIIFLAIDMLAIEGISRLCKLRELRQTIEKQWQREQHITQEHNHEVNLYRDAKRITANYPKHIFAMGVCMLLLKLISLV